MVNMAGKTFDDEVQAEATINYLLEMKHGFKRAQFVKLPLSRRAEIFKIAERRWRKRHNEVPSTNG